MVGGCPAEATVGHVPAAYGGGMHNGWVHRWQSRGRPRSDRTALWLPWVWPVVVAAASLLLVVGSAVQADALTDDRPTADLVLFYGEGCPHCAEEKEFLADLADRRQDLTFAYYEVWFDEGNRTLLADYERELGFTAQGVPVTIVGDRVWVGFSDAIGEQIEEALTDSEAPVPSGSSPPAPTTVDVPLVGSVTLESSSLLLSTLVIGFVDGVNPCSLWVLSVLLAIVLHSESRRRVAAVGFTFLTVTAAMYALYIVGFYSALNYAGQLGPIRVLVAAVALLFGALQLLDGLGSRQTPSLSISAGAKPNLYRRMRRLSSPQASLPALLAGTVVLAVGVSLLETPCTAGLPLLWTAMLTEHGVSPAVAAGLFAAYMFVFLLNELLLFGAAVLTMRATRLQEKHGRALKLLAGSVLVTLATAMLLAPQLMTSVLGAAVIFAIAGCLAVGLWGLSRWLARRRAPAAQAGPVPPSASR